MQVNAALHNEELTEDELKEIAIFLTHYVGFPLGSGSTASIERVAAKRKKAADKGAGRRQEGQRQRRREDAHGQKPR